MSTRLVPTQVAIVRGCEGRRRTFMIQFDVRVDYEQSDGGRTLNARGIVERIVNMTEDRDVDLTREEMAAAIARAVNQAVKDDCASRDASVRIMSSPLFAQVAAVTIIAGLILRTLHLVRPDLIPYPIDAPFYC